MISSPWSLGGYERLCQAVISSGYEICTVSGCIKGSCENKVCFRHDIDRFPKNAVCMAELESSLGIKSTYYVRMVYGVFSQDLACRLSSLGHEVGYHYETLVKSKGDFDEARRLFIRELKILEDTGICIDTAAAHGSPLSGYDSKKIMSKEFLLQSGLAGEAYLSIDYNHMAYYTDTGRSWSACDTNIRDRVDSDASWPVINTLDELIALIESRQLPSICVQTHPERWAYNNLTLLRSRLFDNSTSIAKQILRKVRA